MGRKVIYKTDAYIAPELISVDIKGQLRSLKFGNLIIRPVDYNPFSGIIKVITDLEFRIHFEF